MWIAARCHPNVFARVDVRHPNTFVCDVCHVATIWMPTERRCDVEWVTSRLARRVPVGRSEPQLHNALIVSHEKRDLVSVGRGSWPMPRALQPRVRSVRSVGKTPLGGSMRRRGTKSSCTLQWLSSRNCDIAGNVYQEQLGDFALVVCDHVAQECDGMMLARTVRTCISVAADPSIAIGAVDLVRAWPGFIDGGRDQRREESSVMVSWM